MLVLVKWHLGPLMGAGEAGEQLVPKAMLARNAPGRKGQATLGADKERTAGGPGMCVIAEPSRPWALTIPLGPQGCTNRFTADG